MRLISKVIVLSTIVLVALPALAVNSGVSYQGRILKPDGSPLEGSNVQFRIQIRSPGSENCLLYEEQQNLDMRNSKGVFSLTLNDGSGARLDSSGFPIDRLFANRGTLNFVSGACAIGTSYAPNEADGRKLIVQFKDETMSSWEPMPATNINFVPLALESKQIQGFGSNSLVRIQEADGTMGNVSPLSNASYTELLALIAGSSTQYVRNGTSAGARVPTYTGNPSSPVAGSIWFDSSSNQLKYRDSSGVQAVGTATGSVTSVTAGAGLATTPAGGITSTGSIAIAAGGIVSTMLADGSVVSTKIADGSVSDVKLANGAVVTAKIADGAVTTLKLADSSVTSAKIDDGTIVGADLASNITISTTGSVTASGFTTTGTVTANAVTATTVSSGVNITRQIQLFDPDTGSTNKITFNADSALASDYTLTWPLNDGIANQVLMTDGTGKLSWTTITPGTGDFKADGSIPMTGNLRLGGQWLSNDGGNEGLRVDNSGNVGIGTASPQELLDIAGAIRVGTTTTCGAPNPGTIRYSAGTLEYCNGTAWQTLGVAGAGLTALTGDVTASGSGSVAATIANSAVTSAKIADGTIATADIADKAVTFAKVQDMATNKLVGRSTASSGPMEEIAIGTGLSLSGGTLSSSVTGLPGCSDGELALYVGTAWTCVGATSANTASTVVRRDSSGNIVAGTATLTSSLVLKDGAAGGGVTIATPIGFSNYSLTLPSDDGNSGQVLTTNGSGALSWSSPSTGDFKADGSVAMTGNLKLNNNWLSNDGGNEGIRVDNSGNVGIGTATPQELLDIAGAIRVGTTTTCGAPNPGTIRYNSGNLEYCNGTAWQILGVAGAGITALTGDVTASGSGSVAATIANDAITNAKMADNAIGNAELADNAVNTAEITDSAVTSAKIADGTIATADVADSAITSLKIADGTIATADISNSAVTFAKVQDIATNKIVGRSTASSGPIEEISIGTGLSLSGGTLSSSVTGLPSCADGQLAIYVTSAWTCVGVGSTNTASTVVRRDSSGNFVAGSATLTSSLVLKDGAAGGEVTIATPSGLTSYALTLPSDDGNNGQVLSTNGSGALSWANAATGDFKADGSVSMTGNLKLNDNWLSNDGGNEGIRVDNSGNIGIGTTAPSGTILHVVDNDYTKPTAIFQSACASCDTGPMVLNTATQAGSTAVIKFATAGSGSPQVTGSIGAYRINNNIDSGLIFSAVKNGNGIERMRIDGTGSLGIGTSSPQALLDVAGAIRVGTTTTCGAPNPGTIRYNSGNLEYCNGTAWQVLGIAGSNITALTGDVTATGPGSVAATIANSAVTSAKIADGTIATADVADSAVTSLKIADGTIATADIADKAITFAKVQDMATNKLLGRSTASSGPMEELTVGTGLSLSGGTLSSTLTGLPSCTDGQLALYVGSAWTCVGAVSANTASTVVRRDSSGNFVAGSATLTSSLILKDGAAGGQVSIATPVGFTNYALTLPVDDGTPGQVLATDGSGGLSWLTAGGDFKANGTVPMTGTLQLNNNWLSNDGGAEGIRIDNSGNVGIGTATPGSLLAVNGGTLSVTGPGDAFIDVIAPSGGGRSTLNLAGRGGGGTNSWMVHTGSSDTNLYFKSGNNINSSPNRLTLTGGGNVGIGTTAPASALEVTGDVTLSTGVDRTIAVATPATGNGNALTIKAANGAASTNYGGGVTIQTGNGYWGRAGASLTMGASAFHGGNVTLIAGTPDNAGNPGTTTIQGGQAAGAFTAGAVYIKGGVNPNASKNGGDVYVVGGVPGASGSYGNVFLGWDGSAARGSVGIGTGTPTSTLDVAGTINSSSSTITSGNMISGINTNTTAVSVVGVYGSSGTNGGSTAGVKGVVSNAGYVTGVMGHATATGGGSYATGVYGRTEGGTGIGVSGLNAYQWGGYTGKGGSFEALGPDSYGLYATNSATSGNAIAIYATSPNSASGYAIYSPAGRNYFAGNIGVGVTAPSEKIEVSGNVKATSFITTSDARLKQDIALVPGLEAILKLKGVHWAWKDSHKPDMGVLAQDVEKVFPDAVVTDPRTGFKAVKYQALIAPLIESTKELYGISKANELRNNTRNEAQDREIASLKAENEELKRRLEKIEELLSKKK